MIIDGNQVILNGSLPVAGRDDNNRSGSSRQQAEASSERAAKQPVAVVPSAPVNRAPLQRDVTRIAGLSELDKTFDVFPEPDPLQGTSNQRLAMQTYQQTQDLSRIDSNIDFLGSIDVRV